MDRAIEAALTAIGYGDAETMRGWQAEHDPDGYYPRADAGDLRIHIARRLLVLAETPTVIVLPHRVHGHSEGCECDRCMAIQETLGRYSELSQPVEAF